MPQTSQNPTVPPQLPRELKRWNWGAMLLNVFWGAKHNVDVAFLTLIPGIGLLIPFILGYKGNEWAWKNSFWKSTDEFEKVQSNWAYSGFAIWILLGIFLFLPGLHAGMNLRWSFSPAYRQAVAAFMQTEQIQQVLGSGGRSRILETKTLPAGRVRLEIRFSGTRSKFSGYFYLAQIQNRWEVYRLTLLNGRQNIIDFPLPKNLLCYGTAALPAGQPAPEAYSVWILHSGTLPERPLAALIADLNHRISLEQALALIRTPPQPVYAPVTYAGAAKIKCKLEDFGIRAEIRTATGNPLDPTQPLAYQ